MTRHSRRRRAADSTPGDAPFHGVPIAVKDLAATAGIRTTYSSRAYADYVPDFDTAVVRRIREAGFVIVGKTNTPEFGTVAFTESELNGATRNPWNTELTPGGSSGGAAAAVAAGLVPIAHATDGGGSIRIPASCCGLFGLKPSRGRVSSAPFGSLEGLSTAGPMARTVEDAAHFLDVLAGYEPGDPWWAPPPERPFAVTAGEAAASSPRRGHLDAADRRRRSIPSASPRSPPQRSCSPSSATTCGKRRHRGERLTCSTSSSRSGRSGLRSTPSTPTLMTPLNRGLVESARATSAADYGRAVGSLQTLARRIVSFWSEVDVVVTPTLALPPVPIGWQEEVDGPIEQLLRNTEFTPFTAVANLTGQPAMSLPLHWSEAGLPSASRQSDRRPATRSS